MLEEFTGLGARDFRQRYNHSYGYFTNPSTNKKILVYMSVINDRSAEFKDQRDNVYTANADAGVSFEFIPVKKRLFVCDNTIYLQERQPARMWARGINSQNTRITSVKTLAKVDLNFKRVVAAMEQERYVEVSEGMLLSNIFCILENRVYVYNQCIGKWDAEKQIIDLNDQMFYQELVDLVKKLEKPWKVQYGNND